MTPSPSPGQPPHALPTSGMPWWMWLLFAPAAVILIGGYVLAMVGALHNDPDDEQAEEDSQP